MFVGCNHREHVVLRDNFIVLVRDFGVPPNFAIPGSRAQVFLLARQTHF